MDNWDKAQRNLKSLQLGKIAAMRKTKELGLLTLGKEELAWDGKYLIKNLNPTEDC